jgi:aryl-alcohol dehydrogenase-like predicted oxidoreductase
VVGGAAARRPRECGRRGWDAPVVEQPQYSLLARQRFEGDVRPAATSLGMGLVVWSPLASGVLTGKYDDGIPLGSRLEKLEWLRETFLTDEKMAKVKQFAELAAERGTSRTRLALAWALRQPGVSSVILGATTMAQLEENLAALDDVVDDETDARLARLFAPAGA